ncbi:hypothetical protein BAR24066_00823 [Burkholderia arboris]|uniref:Uncharacterized protein n=1 Tax=Burkholderia arboris TaxID=488730 RepID=A0A9Q9UNH0_9BURK|nr:hypothetical protein BAR24066_00823 [Burkholderia arboris]
MRTTRAAGSGSVANASSSSSESDVDSNLSTQAQLGGRATFADQRFEALNRPQSTRQAIEQRGYTRTLAGLDALRADADGTKLADKAFVAKFAMDQLYSAGLKPKLGGSLASHLHGAPKEPKDVDIEMQSAAELDAAIKHLSGRFHYEGESIKVRAHQDDIEEGVGALLDVKLERSDNRTSSTHVGIDLVNENIPAFNREVVAPERTGSPAVGTADTFRLVVNAIDRHLNKPNTSEAKRDASTVHHLLKSKGYRVTDASHWQAIHDGVASRIRDPRDVAVYMGELRAMLTEYADERGNRSKHHKTRKKADGCTTM